MAIGDGVSSIAVLKLGFGGFSPTAFDGVEATREQMLQAETTLKRMREMEERRRELERARTSRPKTFDDGAGTKWTYVVIDGKLARITACSTEVPQLNIPAEIEGYPVYGIAADACSRNDFIEEVICPDSIESIGSCAFRFCANLRKVVFPDSVSTFSASWLSHCPSIEELVLPGLLDKIESSVFDNEGLRRLHIGRNVSKVVPGAFEKAQLESVDLDPRNPYLKTDGAALYSHDGTVLIALCTPVSHLTLAEGCEKVAKKACCNMHALQSVSLPDTLQTIGKFSFAHSGVNDVVLPSSTRVVGEKAFFHCRELRTITLNDGLTRIDDSAFEESSLESLSIPASIEHIGSSIIARSNVVASGDGATISIDAKSPSLFLDGSGGLYRRLEDGVHLVQLIDEECETFEAHRETRFVDDRAFALHKSVREAVFHDGLEVVGPGAFRVCNRMRSVTLPDSVRVIGVEAFYDTNIESFRIPASLEKLGENALVTMGARHIGEPPSIKHVEVAPGNAKFFVNGGMLCERFEKGVRVVVYTGENPDVVIADDVTRIEPYAFSNARGVRTLHLPSSIKTIGTAGLGVWSYVDNIHVQLASPIEGRTEFDFQFPNTSRSVHSISLALGGSSWVNVPDIMAQYDNCIVNAHDYRGLGRDSISVYEQIRRVIARLEDPILLTNVNRSLFDRLIKEHIEEICVDIARHDDRQAIDSLLTFGYLNEKNLEDVITAVGRLQDAAMTAYLLEVKRRRFNKRTFDFDL